MKRFAAIFLCVALCVIFVAPTDTYARPRLGQRIVKLLRGRCGSCVRQPVQRVVAPVRARVQSSCPGGVCPTSFNPFR